MVKRVNCHISEISMLLSYECFLSTRNVLCRGKVISFNSNWPERVFSYITGTMFVFSIYKDTALLHRSVSLPQNSVSWQTEICFKTKLSGKGNSRKFTTKYVYQQRDCYSTAFSMSTTKYCLDKNMLSFITAC